MSEVAEHRDWDHYRGDSMVSVLKRQRTGCDFWYLVYTHTGNAHPQLATCKCHMFEFRACAAAVNIWAHIYLLLYLSVRISI